MMNVSWAFRGFLGLLLMGELLASPVYSQQPKAPLPAAESGLTLDQYLDQVRGGSQPFQGASALDQAGDLRQVQGDLAGWPVIMGSMTNFDNHTPSTSSFAPLGTKGETRQIGLQWTSPIGLGASYTQNITHNTLTIAPAAAGFYPLTDYYQSSTVLEVNQPLWRNFLGAESRAQRDVLESSALAMHYGGRYQKKMILADAEMTYWRLALNQELVRIQTAALERSNTLVDYNERRGRLNLADRSDLLQAQALNKQSQMDLQRALDGEKSAAAAFNMARGLAGDQVAETLTPPPLEFLLTQAPPPRADMRDDVRAAEQNRRLASANAQMGLERAKPDVVLFANSTHSGLAATESAASSQVSQGTYPSSTVGVRMTFMLGPGLTDVWSSYRAEQDSAEAQWRQKMLEQERDWTELNRQLTETRARLKLAVEVEAIQREKLDYERERMKRGRSTTSQVILFESDFARAQQSRIQTQIELISILARLKTWAEDTSSSETP
ncbi:MAG: TolC family protein [Deltaproteobacteria bacterium]|nr:TolC family protein [Deltaproteobacteria bacterium]